MKNSKVLLSIVLITSLVITSSSHALSDDKTTPNYMLAAAGACVLIFKNQIMRIPLGFFFISQAFPEKTEKLINETKKYMPAVYKKIETIFETKLNTDLEENLNTDLEESLKDKVRTDVE